MDATPTIRRAVAADRDAALAFTGALAPFFTYLPDVLDHWLGDSAHHEVFVAEDGGALLGIVHLDDLGLGDGMLTTVGVTPSQRRSGLGTRLVAAAAAAAQARGLVWLRLETQVPNVAAQAAFTRAGFSVTTRVEWLDGPAIAAPPQVLRMATAADLPALAALIPASAALRDLGGVYQRRGWRWTGWHPEHLAPLVARGRAALWEQDGAVRAFALEAERTARRLFFGLADCAAADGATLLTDLRRWAAQRGAASVELGVGAPSALLIAAGTAGLAWQRDDADVIMSRRLT